MAQDHTGSIMAEQGFKRCKKKGKPCPCEEMQLWRKLHLLDSICSMPIKATEPLFIFFKWQFFSSLWPKSFHSWQESFGNNSPHTARRHSAHNVLQLLHLPTGKGFIL